MSKRVIIVIGLPGSGKTTFLKYLKSYECFDDFIGTFYDGHVITSLKSGKRVALADPRLCIPKIFLKYIDEIELYVPRDEIVLILFDTPVDTCINNATLRSDGRFVLSAIFEFSKNYLPETYSKWTSLKPNQYLLEF